MSAGGQRGRAGNDSGRRPSGSQRWRNWGRSESATPLERATPRSADEVAALVRRARERGHTVKAVGAGHSFTAIAATSGVQVDLAALSGLIEVDAERGRATLAGGTPLHRVPALLQPHGLAMQNLGDIDRQTISGAISTGTHGTGAGFGGLATQVVGMTLVTADGSVLRVSETENASLLPAVALGLGALGIIVDVTLQCVPAFLLRAVERPERLERVLDDFSARAAAVDHFEFYWFPHTDTVLTKTNTRLGAGMPREPLGPVRRYLDDTVMANGLFRMTCSAGLLAPAAIPAINRLATRLTGNRTFTDASASVFTTRRTVRFREQEYAIPREAVPQVVRDIRALIAKRNWRISFPIEVRVAAADDLMLSTAHDRDSGYVAVHRFWREDHREYFREVERIMVGYDGRPHWGKIHFQDAASLATRYPRFSDFVAIRNRLDPDRVFGNPYLERVLGP